MDRDVLMMEAKNKNRILKNLEKDLNRYDKIFLISCFEENDLYSKMINNLESIYDDANYQISINRNQYILILFAGKNFENEESKYDKKIRKINYDEKYLCIEKATIIYRKITKEEVSFLYQLYHIYEFSNRFFLISIESMHGSIFNFIDTGLFCFKEVMEALLC